MSKTNKKYSDLCTQTCPYRLARLGTSLRIRGKLTLRKKKYSFYYLNTLFVINLCRILRYESDYVLSSIIVPNLAAAQEWRHEWIAFFNGITFLPVILERSEEFGQRVQDLTVLTCVHTCLYRLARLGTSLRVRGKLTLRKKEIIVFQNGVICLWWFRK